MAAKVHALLRMTVAAFAAIAVAALILYFLFLGYVSTPFDPTDRERRRHRSSASTVEWCRRLPCVFYVRRKSCLTLSDYRGPQQPFRRGRNRLGGRIRGKKVEAETGREESCSRARPLKLYDESLFLTDARSTEGG